ERLALPIFLDDGQLAQLHPLEGREPGGAIRAEAPAPYRAAIVGRPRILYLRVIRAAERTTHPRLPFAGPERRARDGRLRDAPRHDLVMSFVTYRSGTARTTRRPPRAPAARPPRCRRGSAPGRARPRRSIVRSV